MNQTQRQFLLTAIESQFKKECSVLKEKRPTAPSLNNYLVAAVLDKSFKLQPAEHVRKAIHARVLSLGQKDTLVERKSDRWGRDDEDDEKQPFHMTIPADVIFEMPKGYEMARAQYEEQKEEWDKKMAALSASFEAMKIKVQLGSDKALGALVDQADSLCSMSLTASSKLLIANQ